MIFIQIAEIEYVFKIFRVLDIIYFLYIHSKRSYQYLYSVIAKFLLQNKIAIYHNKSHNSIFLINLE